MLERPTLEHTARARLRWQERDVAGKSEASLARAVLNEDGAIFICCDKRFYSLTLRMSDFYSLARAVLNEDELF